jgi:hypothetical protein
VVERPAHRRRAFEPKIFAKAAWVIDDLLLLFVGMRPIVELMHLM